MKLLLKLGIMPLILLVLGGAAYATAYIRHEMKPSLLEYQKTVIATGDARKIYLVNLGWHTDIVVRTSDVPLEMFPEMQYFQAQEYLAIGWGDAAFYPATELPPQFILQTLFAPTETVMHVAGFSGHPQDTFEFTNVLTLHVSKVGFDKMMQAMSDTVARENTSIAPPLRTGQYGQSYFFAANGAYHALNHCNHWTAQMLEAADIPFNQFSAISAGSVLWQARRYGSE